MDRFLDWYVLAALGCLAFLGIGRGVMLSRRGVPVFAIDRERSLPEGLSDLAFIVCFVLWIYELVAFSLPLGFHVIPSPLEAVVIDAIPVKLVGAALMAAALVVYGLALHVFGASWRLGIDRAQPGELITGGIFSRSRNPVYLGLALLGIGSCLVLGRLVFFLFSAGELLYFHSMIRREERFLADHYGDAYREYAARVGRYWTWP